MLMYTNHCSTLVYHAGGAVFNPVVQDFIGGAQRRVVIAAQRSSAVGNPGDKLADFNGHGYVYGADRVGRLR